MTKRSLPLLLLCIACVMGAEPKRDRFGDPLPEGAVARLGSLRLRPEWPVVSGDFSPDGKLLATCGGRFHSKGAVTLWDTATGKEMRRLAANLSFSLNGLRFSADGKSLFLIGSDGNFRVVDATTGAEKRKLDTSTHNLLLAVDLARDEKTAVTTDFRGNIVVWDLVRGKRLLERTIPVNRFHWTDRAPFRPLTALTPDGKQLVSPQADCSLYLVNVASGEKVVAFEMPESRPKHASHLELPTVAVSPDGRYLAYASTWIPAVLCDLKTGKILHPLTARSTNSMRFFFTPDSRSVIVHSGSAIYLIDTASGKQIRKIERSSWMGHPLTLSPDGKTLAHLEGQHAISLWDLSTGRQLRSSVRHVSLVQSMIFFPDGERLASSDQSGNLIVWDIVSAQALAHHKKLMTPRSLALDVDGETLRFLTFDRMIHRWNPTAGREAAPQKIPEGNLVAEVALSPDGRTLAATIINTPFSQAQLFDLPGGKATRTIVLSDKAHVRGLLFSPDSRRLLTGAYDFALRLWERDTGKLVRQIQGDFPNNLHDQWAFASDSRSLAYSYSNGHVFIREIISGEVRFHVSLPNMSHILAFSPNSRFLACGQPSGGILFVFDTATGKQLARWNIGQLTMYSLAISPDSRLLASGGGDGTILLWKLPEAEALSATLKKEEALTLWKALADDDAARANRALAGLAAAPAQAVPLIKQRFPTTWKKPDARQIARRITELDDDAFQVRERATRELAEAGSDAADALRQALAKAPSAEAKRRIEGLLNRLSKGGSPERLRALRAIEVLERIGTPQARDLLRELAHKPLPAELAEEVQASLRRLGDRH